MSGTRIRTLIAAFCVVLAGLGSASAASAATITVTTTVDQYGEDAGNCGLREAIRSAEGIDAGGYGGCAQGDDFDLGAVSDTINVPAGTFNLTIPGVEDANSMGDLDILDSSLTIQSTAAFGNTTTIAGTGNITGGDRVFDVGVPVVAMNGIRIRNGFTTGDGGGIRAGGGFLDLESVTLDGNSAGGNGGGIRTGGSVDFDNVTLSGNTANGSGGGLAYVGALNSTLPQGLNNTTIVGNTADADGALGDSGGGTANFGAGLLQRANTIIAENSDLGALSPSPDCSGTLNSGGHNLTGTDLNCTLNSPPASDLTGTGTGAGRFPANLAPLASNGGTTLTRTPLRTSPAVNRGYPGSGPGTTCESFDANQVNRPLEGRCDIGAVETPAAAQTYSADTASDDYNVNTFTGTCSLREAVQAANDNQAFGGCQAGSTAADTVNVPQGVQLTRNGVDDTNVNGDLDITSSSLTIQGTGTGEREIRNNGGGDRVLHVGSGLTGIAVSNVAIKDGNTAGDGGGILNEGTLGLTRASISNSFAGGNGGGISYTSTGTGTITNATISGNVTNGSGGGIANSQPAAFQPVFNNITVTNNTADQDDSGDGSGGYAGFTGGADIANSILAGNIDGSPSSANPNCGGAPLISSGYNLAGADCGLAATGDTSTLSGIAALAFNGGNSLTHALLTGSPAINTGNPGPGGKLCATTDQRAVAREGVCDRGAYEFTTAPPPAPTVTDSDPDSPANDNNPEIKGSAQAGSTVQLYTDAGCTTAIGAATPAGSFATPGITVSVANNTTTTFYAKATNAGGPSLCSATGLTYQEVTPPPAPPAPTVDDSDPNSPANDNNPEIKGTAQAGSTVQLYTDSGCATPIGSSAPAATFASPGITVTVADNTTTTFYAQASNAGGPSPCSAAGFSYQEVTPSTGGGGGTTTPITPITPVTPGTPAPKKCKKGQKLKKGKCVKKRRKKK